MSEGINRVMLLGNLGADPELRFGQGADQAVLRLRIATTESYFDKRSNERKERTDWHNVVCFGKRGEALQKILSKGSSVLVEGRIQTSSYEKDGQKVWKTDIIANNIVLTGGKRDSGDAPRASGGGYGGGVARAPKPAEQRAEYDDFVPAGGDSDEIQFLKREVP